MKQQEFKNQIIELAKAYQNDEVELKDAEIIERSALKLIAEFIFSNDLLRGMNWDFEIPSDPSESSSEKLRYIIDRVSLTDDSVFDLNWTIKNSFWDDYTDSKACYLDLLKEMVNNKDAFYSLDDDF